MTEERNSNSVGLLRLISVNYLICFLFFLSKCSVSD